MLTFDGDLFCSRRLSCLLFTLLHLIGLSLPVIVSRYIMVHQKEPRTFLSVLLWMYKQPRLQRRLLFFVNQLIALFRFSSDEEAFEFILS